MCVEPNNFDKYMTLYDDETGEYYTVKNSNYSPESTEYEND